MLQVRFDSPGEVLCREVAADGSVRATADVARCGIYTYRNADGTVRRELVLPEHLFAPESLKTLAGVAVTSWPPQGHPPELLNPENSGKYAVGNVHETVDAVDAQSEQDFGYVRVRLTGRTADAVRKLQQPKLWTSPGYSLPQYDATPGVHPVWGVYDAIQGPRVYNHLALTDTPRGGDQMRVHMDSADLAVQEFNQEAPMAMVKIRLDSTGRDVELDQLAAEIVRQELARRDADEAVQETAVQTATQKLAELEAQVAAHKKAMDEAMASMEKLKGEQQAMAAKQAEDAKRADAAESILKDQAKLRAILAPRVALETTARQYLPKDQHPRIDAMDDDQVRAAVVGVLLPAVKTDGVRGDRLVGLYEGALATRSTRTDSAPPAKDSHAPDPQSHGGKSSADLHKARTDAEYIPPGKGRKVA